MGANRAKDLRAEGAQAANGTGRGRPLLDAVNPRLLEELLDEPRLSTAELARRVDLSAPAVAERLQRLKSAGVIEGFRLQLNPAALGLPLAAYVRIRPGPGQLGSIVRLAERTPQVLECHRVTGEENLLLKVQVANLDQLTDVVDLFFALGQTTTCIVQGSPIPYRRLPVADDDGQARSTPYQQSQRAQTSAGWSMGRWPAPAHAPS